MLVVLDSGPLGLLSNPTATGPAYAARDWATTRLRTGDLLCVPEIADYEVRRELLRIGKARGIRRLDTIKATARYAPLTTETMLLAAQLWADVRRRGQPTADPHALDGDVILAAQAMLLASAGDSVVVATMNAMHLTRFVDARAWEDIPVS